MANGPTRSRWTGRARRMCGAIKKARLIRASSLLDVSRTPQWGIESMRLTKSDFGPDHRPGAHSDIAMFSTALPQLASPACPARPNDDIASIGVPPWRKMRAHDWRAYPTALSHCAGLMCDGFMIWASLYRAVSCCRSGFSLATVCFAFFICELYAYNTELEGN